LVSQHDDPALAERLLARAQHTQRVTVLSAVILTFAAGPYYWFAVLGLVVGVWVGDYPSRRVLLDERWGLGTYLAWQLRFHTPWLGFWVALLPPPVGIPTAAGSRRPAARGGPALAGGGRARAAARPVGHALHADVPLARAGATAAVAAPVAADHRPVACRAPSAVRDACARRTLRQRVRISVAECPERALHRARAAAAQPARAGRRFRARGRPPGALRSAALSNRNGDRGRTRAHGDARRHARAGATAAGARRGPVVVGPADRLRLEGLAPEGARDRQRCSRGRTVRGPGGAHQWADEAHDRGARAAPVERRARARLLASEPRPTSARDSPGRRDCRDALRRSARRRDHPPDGAHHPRP